MTKPEKRRFIRELLGGVQKDLLAKVAKMPDEWDGHELRQLIAEKLEPVYHLKGKRKAEYNNAVMTKNL